ncbi:MFS transporter [Salinicoccus sp. YB14-2]|uniref:MFS transporter n=1 Tax=Salinicoccus sp. YB14-2 TaxID=1572701 RepID=UPI00068CAC59|nr:MFS transporter [Salinicoccus sp. YB14-2]
MLLNKDVPYAEKLNFIIYLVSRLMTNLGNLVYMFAVSYSILYTTGSAFYFSINLALMTLVSLLLLPFSGWLSDVWNKRTLIISGEVMMTFIIGGLLIYSYLYGFNLIAIYVTTVLTSFINPFISNAYQAAMTEMFHAERIQKVMGYTSSIMSSAVILGPALGGVLFGLFDFYIMILVFFIAYLISAVLDFFVKFKLYYDEKNYESEEILGEAALSKASKFKKDISKGFVYIWDSTILKRVFIMAAIINFFTALLAIYPEKMMIVELGFNPEAVGVINSFDGVGALIAGAVLGTIKQINSPIRVMKIGLQLLSVMFLIFLLPIYVSMPQFGTMIFFASMGFIIAVLVQVINVPFFTYMQVITPQNIKGRVFSVVSIFAMSIQPLGTLLYGVLYDVIPYWIIHVVSFLLLSAAVIVSIKEDTIKRAKNQFIAKTAEIKETGTGA